MPLLVTKVHSIVIVVVTTLANILIMFLYKMVFICSDNIPTYKIKSWPADSTFFDGDPMAGPFPSLFSTDSIASLAGIIKDPKKCHWDLMKISRLILMPESVGIEEAIQITKKPR